jgi:hypothetical protein
MMTRRDAPFQLEQVKQLALVACSADPSWQASAPDSLKQTESLFVENQETVQMAGGISHARFVPPPKND